MVVLNARALEHISLLDVHNHHKLPNNNNGNTTIPVIDMSRSEAKALMVKACENLGFFKVINHGVSVESMATLEAEAVKFFSMPEKEKDKVGLAKPYGYGNKMIGPNGDVGWLEYLLMQITPKSPSSPASAAFLTELASNNGLWSALNKYVSAVRKLTSDVLEMIAEGLGIANKDVFSRLVMDEDSDTVFRLNHYPPCPEIQKMGMGMDHGVTGFGEHTDPQIISVLRSNNTCGLQISLADGTWVPVPADHASFFINVGDSLQVLTNGRFRSVRHRVLANSLHSRFSMIYFGGPPCGERIAPLPMLMEEGEESHYREFTWFEYKMSAYRSRLADNRLALFQIITGNNNNNNNNM